MLAWGLTAVIAGVAAFKVWTCFDDPARSGGTYGHTTIDFGGQYLMGRMLVRGQAQHLYHRAYQRDVLREVYPRAAENPAQETRDVESLMGWMMGSDSVTDANQAETVATFLLPLAGRDAGGCFLSFAATAQVRQYDSIYQLVQAVRPLAARDPIAASLHAVHAQQPCAAERMEFIATLRAPPVGGPLYPPVNSFYYAPLALLSPVDAYRVMQALGLALAFAVGAAVTSISRGQIWWPIASGLVIMYPGFGDSAALGQNAAITLTILVWGWALIARGHPGWGGVVWGFLAFKPVWAAAFFLVPLLTRRWRVCAAMALTGLALAAATVPFVGWHAWREWLFIGGEATETYRHDFKWTFLSRDLLTLPRRLLDFSDKTPWYERRDNFPAAVAGWCLLLAAFAITVRVALARPERVRQTTGPGPAFLFLGAWLCCFHFMYYDAALTCLPVFLLFTEPRRYLEPLFLAIIPASGHFLGRDLQQFYRPGVRPLPLGSVPLLPAGPGNLWVLNRVEPTVLAVLAILHVFFANLYTPYDTYAMMALWLWSGWLCLYRPAQAEGGAEAARGAGEPPVLRYRGPLR